MRKSKKIKLNTYNCNVIVILTDELTAIVNDIYRKSNFKEKFLGEAEGVVVTIDIDNYYMVLDVEYLTHNTICHELYHAVVRVTEDRDISDEEAQAWLMGHLAQEVHKFIKKTGYKIIR